VGKVDDAVKHVKDQINGLSTGQGIGGGKGKKKGGLLDLIAPELTHPGEFISFFSKTIGKVTGVLKGFAKKYTAKLGVNGLGDVKSIAGRAKDAALGFARRAYRALLNASFPGSSVVKAAARAASAFAHGTYRATLRALDRASSVGRRVMGYLRSIFHPITVTINAVLGHVPKLPFFHRLGGVKHMQAGGNTTLVGEEGPELVDLPTGAYVRPEATTRGRMMQQQQGAGMAGPIVINVQLDGKTLASLLFDPLKGVVRQKGGKGPGSAQKAWGYA
jgi:hypothetical protein